MIEVCGGSGALSLNRYWWFTECVYNELNSKITNLFVQLKSKNTREDLINEIINMNYSKDFFGYALKHYNNDYIEIDNKLEQALLTYTVIFQSFNNEKKSYSNKPHSKSLKYNTEYNLYKVAQALENIEITQKNCFEIINEDKDNDKLFIYADVPYIHSTRNGAKDSYGENFEWSDEQHLNFVNLVKDSKNKIMIFNYDNKIYDILLNDDMWHKINIKTIVSPTPKSDGTKNIRKEYVYINYDSFSNLAEYSIKI